MDGANHDQQAAPVVMTATKAAAPAPAAAVKAEPGLEYELLFKETSRQENVFYSACEKSESSRSDENHWPSLAELKDACRVQRGISRGSDAALCGERRSAYAFKFKGLLRVPTDGLYHSTDGGATLKKVMDEKGNPVK